VARRRLSQQRGTLILDCEGLSRLVSDDDEVVTFVARARRRGMEAAISSLTIIEATHRRTDRPRLNWILSGLRIVPVGDDEAKAAADILISAGLHGHKYAIDAAVAEMALRQQRPVVMLTSDMDDMAKLCGDRVRLVAV
jgi:predicted nucleic acid-binding protein